MAKTDLRTLLDYAQETDICSSDLDDLVRELKLKEAKRINEGGLEHQLYYIHTQLGMAATWEIAESSPAPPMEEEEEEEQTTLKNGA